MKKHGVLNPELSRALAELGHFDKICIADAGLPIPEHIQRIDLSLVQDIPLVAQVLKALEQEIEVAEIRMARETSEVSPKLAAVVDELWPATKKVSISHEELKAELGQCRFVIRTGEFTPYANVILVSGVPF